MFKFIVDYDPKHSSCKALLPKEMEEKEFETIESGLNYAFNYFKTIKELICDPPVFIDCFERPYSDALKFREYSFDSLTLFVVGAEWIQPNNFIVLDCVTANNKELKAEIVLKLVEIEK